MSKTNNLQIIKSGLHRTAGPYRMGQERHFRPQPATSTPHANCRHGAALQKRSKCAASGLVHRNKKKLLDLLIGYDQLLWWNLS